MQHNSTLRASFWLARYGKCQQWLKLVFFFSFKLFLGFRPWMCVRFGSIIFYFCIFYFFSLSFIKLKSLKNFNLKIIILLTRSFVYLKSKKGKKKKKYPKVLQFYLGQQIAIARNAYSISSDDTTGSDYMLFEKFVQQIKRVLTN